MCCSHFVFPAPSLRHAHVLPHLPLFLPTLPSTWVSCVFPFLLPFFDDVLLPFCRSRTSSRPRLPPPPTSHSPNHPSTHLSKLRLPFLLPIFFLLTMCSFLFVAPPPLPPPLGHAHLQSGGGPGPVHGPEQSRRAWRVGASGRARLSVICGWIPARLPGTAIRGIPRTPEDKGQWGSVFTLWKLQIRIHSMWWLRGPQLNFVIWSLETMNAKISVKRPNRV